MPTTPSVLAEDRRYMFGRGRTLLIVTGVVTGIFVVSVNQAMLVVSVPTIVGELGGLSTYSWIFTIYFLASTITIPTWARLSDQYGRRPLLALSIALFLVGSLVCALAPTLATLFVGRAIQGIGAGGTVPIGMAATADIMAPKERGKWLGYEAAVTVSAQFGGPLLGGLITETAGWRWAFAISVPFAATSLLITWFAMKIPANRERHRIDVTGSILLAGLLVTGLLAVTLGGTSFAWGSPAIVLLLLACAGLGVAFGFWERRVPEPVVPLDLYRHRTFLAASLMVWGITGAMWAINIYVPLFAQGVLDASPASSGLILLPFGLSFVVFSAILGRAMSRSGHYRWQLFLSPIVVLVGLVLLTRMSPIPGESEIVPILIICGLGLALGNSVTIAVQNVMPRKMMATALGGLHFARILGGAVVLNVLGVVMNSSVRSELATSLPVDSPLRHVNPDRLIARSVPISGTDSPIVHYALARAIPTVFYVLMPLVALSFLAAFMVERKPLRDTIGDAREIELEAATQREVVRAGREVASGVPRQGE